MISLISEDKSFSINGTFLLDTIITLLDDFLEDNIDLYEGCPAESWTLLIVLLFAVRSSFNSTNTCIYSMSVKRCMNGFIKYNLQIVND